MNKLWVIPGALTAVLFPAFAARALERSAEAWRLFHEAVNLLFWGLWPMAPGQGLFSHELLPWWINADFAMQGAPILQVLSPGILINCLTHVPLTWL